MAVTYSTGTATVSGGTSGAPYDLDDIVAAVADTALADLDGDGTYYINVNIDIQGWLKINDDANVITHGYIKKTSGGMIHGYRSVLRYEGAGQGGDSTNSTFPNGFAVHAFKDVAGKNPAIYIQTSGREDAFAAHYPSGGTVDFNVTGLDLLVIGAASTSAKVYAGSGSTLDGVRFYRYTSSPNAEIQFIAGDYSDFYLLNATISTGVAAGIVLNCYNWVFDFNGSTDNIIFNFNNTVATANIIDPSFANGAWSGSYEGEYSGFRNSATCVANVLYTDSPTFLQGAAAVSGMAVRYTRNDSTIIDVTSDGNGETAATQLLTSYRANGEVGVLAATATYTWSCVARSYDKLVAGSDALFTSKTFNGLQRVTSQCINVPGLNVTKTAAQALTGISASGTTITLTSSHSAENIFAIYRLFISDPDNFATADSVTKSGSTISLDTWTVSIGASSASDGLSFDGGTVVLTAATAYTMTLTTNIVNFNASGTFDLTGSTITGTIELINSSAGAVTVQVSTGTSYTNTGPSITVQEIGDTPTLTASADRATATVRGFTNNTQTTVFSESDGSVDYEYPNTNPIDIEIVEQGYVPINDQDVVPFDGPINYTMDLDEAYNASHNLTIVTHYTLDRGTKNFNILSDQNAFDVRSSMADTIRLNSSYYNTPLLLEAKPGGKRIDLIDGATITSMATWKGAGMERYDALGTIYPIEKWYSIQSVQDITGASVIYRQTNSGDFTIGALTGGKFDETLQFYSDTTVPPDNNPETNNDSYLLIKALRVGYRQARNDVVAGNGGASLKSDLYTIGLAPTAHDYAGGPIDLSATMTLVAGGTVGGKTFSYKWVDAGTNLGTDIADWINYMGATSPNGIIPGGTGLRWAEMPDMVIYVTGGVETAQGYREGATPTLVGFYMERGGSDHPDLVRAQADDGTYYRPAQSATATISNFATTSRLQIYDTLNAVELYNGVPGATSYQFSETYTVDRDIRVRITNKVTTTASIMIEATVGSITASNPDVAYIANQSADTTYNNNAVDGDTVTGITINDTTDRVEIGIAGGSVPWKNIYAYQVAWLHTEAGIRDDFAFIDAPDTANYILTGFKIKNTSSPSVPLVITGGYGRDATTGASIDLIDTTGGSLFFAPDHVIPYATGSGVTSADKTEIIAGVTSSVSDTLPDAVWQSPKAIPKLLSVE